ncbi:13250_t:CDS:2 [Cetraspora pellucida]|uniref:13250_t:CDS:1 n=1 Tax=Cetraspora pellucida TaxID=1433469 RepID=A0ACA9JWZ9_9GLOM|nr:13250_t:CDS:2 [Cetraspora pellucida]
MSTGASIPSVEIPQNFSLKSIENSEKEEPRRCNTNNDSPSGIPPQQFQSQSPPQPLVREQPVDQQRLSPPKKPSHAKKLVDKFATFSPMRSKGSDRKLIVETAYSNYNAKKEVLPSADQKTQKKKKRITEGMSKADIFAASVASAVDAADGADEEEVYYTYSTSNSRTPSLTSLNGMAAPLSTPNYFQENNNIPQQYQMPPNIYNTAFSPHRTYNTFPNRSHFPTGFYHNNPPSDSVDIIPNHSPNDKSNNKPTGVMRSSLPDMSQYVKGLPNYDTSNYLYNNYNNWYVNDERLPLFSTKLRPPTQVNIKDITNVLTSDKELMFDIQVKGRNFGLVDVEIIDADLNVFATPVNNIPSGIPGGPGSHWDDDDNIITNSLSFHESAPNEYLGTILAFDEPLIFPSGINRTGVVSTPTAQVRLKSPGGDDKASQDRWSYLLRHQFDLTVRGVLKYTLPFSKNYVTRVCFSQRVDGTESSLDKDGKNMIVKGFNTNLILGQCGDWEKEEQEKNNNIPLI